MERKLVVNRADVIDVLRTFRHLRSAPRALVDLPERLNAAHDTCLTWEPRGFSIYSRKCYKTVSEIARGEAKDLEKINKLELAYGGLSSDGIECEEDLDVFVRDIVPRLTALRTLGTYFFCRTSKERGLRVLRAFRSLGRRIILTGGDFPPVLAELSEEECDFVVGLRPWINFTKTAACPIIEKMGQLNVKWIGPDPPHLPNLMSLTLFDIEVGASDIPEDPTVLSKMCPNVTHVTVVDLDKRDPWDLDEDWAEDLCHLYSLRDVRTVFNAGWQECSQDIMYPVASRGPVCRDIVEQVRAQTAEAEEPIEDWHQFVLVDCNGIKSNVMAAGRRVLNLFPTLRTYALSGSDGGLPNSDSAAEGMSEIDAGRFHTGTIELFARFLDGMKVPHDLPLQELVDLCNFVDFLGNDGPIRRKLITRAVRLAADTLEPEEFLSDFLGL